MISFSLSGTTLSFPQDRRSPGFFLKIAENTGDNFVYHILTAKDIKDISKYCNPVLLVRCIVRPRDMPLFDTPRCSRDVDGFKLTNANGDETFSEVEYNTNLAEQKLVDEEMLRCQVPDNSTVITPGEEDITETGHKNSQAFESLLTLDIDIPKILEEQEDEDINDCPITEDDTAIGVDQEITPIVTIHDDSTPPPHMYLL